MVWVGVSVNGTAGLFYLATRSDHVSSKICNLLENKLSTIGIHNCTTFMQVDTPCHRVKIASQFLKSKKISDLDWPENSPDLSPVENLWTVLKNKVSKRHQLELRVWIMPSK